MIKFGWIRKAKKGYFLVSYHRFSGLYRLKIFGDTEEELLARASALSFDKSIIKQIYKKFDKNHVKRKQRLRLYKQRGTDCESYSVGVRWFQNLFGYKSAASGSKIQNLMEQFGLAKIKRNEINLGEYSQDVWRNLVLYGMESRISYKEGFIFERLINHITLVK